MRCTGSLGAWARHPFTGPPMPVQSHRGKLVGRPCGIDADRSERGIDCHIWPVSNLVGRLGRFTRRAGKSRRGDTERVDEALSPGRTVTGRRVVDRRHGTELSLSLSSPRRTVVKSSSLRDAMPPRNHRASGMATSPAVVGVGVPGWPRWGRNRQSATTKATTFDVALNAKGSGAEG
jgi:hypothetical protein